LRRIGAWIDERLGIYALCRAFLDRKIPGNIGWWHTLGSALLVLLLIQIATGIALTLSYVPSPEHAYDSILFIDATPFGGLVRGIHHWAASLLVLLIGPHPAPFIWGAYRYPGAMAWMGARCCSSWSGFGFTGYLLPWDQKAYWATVVGTNVAGSAPSSGSGHWSCCGWPTAGCGGPDPLLRGPYLRCLQP
jgi:quinol-cytochrome oxidoreductase complex cytochrome b subunit